MKKFSKQSSKQRKTYQSYNLDKKILLTKKIIKEAFDNFDTADMAVAWTGGKDSTVLLWLIRQVAKENNFPMPTCVFIDEGDVFDEIWTFTDKLKKEWQLNLSVAHNKDVSSQVKNIGDQVTVEKLNKTNQRELKKLDFTEKNFPFEPESYVGNHLMKTVALNQWLKENKTQALFVGVRWDEQEARSEDDFFRKIKSPSHWRVEPILPLLEKDIWEITHQFNVPFVKLYEQGYRSLGAKKTTTKDTTVPAWEQDLDGSTERSGRRQDKEKIMSRLRDLGYM